VKELYQWLSRRAMAFLSGSFAPAGRVIQTEVTIERQGITMLLSGVAASDFEVCPLCGGSLSSVQAEAMRGCLQEGSNSRHESQGDGA